jgi:hypothetical protein
VTATITKFRKDLFGMADQALKGEPVEFVYRGVVFKVTPEKKLSKLDKLVGQPVVAEGIDLEQASKELFAGMEAEWLKDWSEL